MSEIPITWFSDPEYLQANAFSALADISRRLVNDENLGRQALVRALEHQVAFANYQQVLASLVQRAGLHPYLLMMDGGPRSTGDELDFEFHVVEGLEDVVLHSMQGKVYRALCDGANIILSAPTSFGKSLLIDAMIASRRFECIVVIVPTIALIDETRPEAEGD